LGPISGFRVGQRYWVLWDDDLEVWTVEKCTKSTVHLKTSQKVSFMVSWGKVTKMLSNDLMGKIK